LYSISVDDYLDNSIYYYYVLFSFISLVVVSLFIFFIIFLKSTLHVKVPVNYPNYENEDADEVLSK
jgi:hypothetical protein